MARLRLPTPVSMLRVQGHMEDEWTDAVARMRQEAMKTQSPVQRAKTTSVVMGFRATQGDNVSCARECDPAHRGGAKCQAEACV